MSQQDPANPFAPPQSTSTAGAVSADAGKFANCPSCGVSDAKRVGFSWWGGVLGPKMFTHVKCNQCRTTYNGKSGKSNNSAIAIYVVVSFAIFFVLGAMIVLLTRL